MSQCKRCSSHAINPTLHGRQPGVDLDLCDVCYWRMRAETFINTDSIRRSLQGGLSYEEIYIACRNVGINLECGGCASEFYSGHSEEHDKNCSRLPPLYQVEVSNGQITNLKVVDERTHRGTSSYELGYLRGYLELPPDSTDKEVRVKVIEYIKELKSDVDGG